MVFQSIADVFFTYGLIVLVIAIMAATLLSIDYFLGNRKPSFDSYEDAACYFSLYFPSIRLEKTDLNKVAVLMYFGWNVRVDDRKRHLIFRRGYSFKEFRIGNRFKDRQFLVPKKK